MGSGDPLPSLVLDPASQGRQMPQTVQVKGSARYVGKLSSPDPV